MKNVIGFIFAVTVLFTASQVGAQSAPLQISELFYDAEGSDTDKEWIEVVNIGSEPFVIVEGNGDDALRIFDGSSHLISLAQGTTTIAVNEAIVFVDDSEQWLLDHPSFSGTVFDTVLSLSNSGEQVGLQFGSGGELFNHVSYDSSMGAAGNGKTLELLESGQWQESSAIGGSPGVWPHTENVVVEDIPQETEDSSDEVAVIDDDSDQPDWSYDFHITELIPNPVGSDDGEWIEVYNASPFLIDTTGWSITDASGKKYTFKNIEINPFSYYVLDRVVTGIALNNTGDELYLYTDDGSLRESITYTGGTEGQAWGWFQSGWEWTEHTTPGSDNVKNNVISPDPVTTDEDQDTIPQTTVVLPAEDTLRVTELLPNPEGPDVHEWIELHNAGLSSFDLSGWKMIDDSKKKPFVFPDGTVIAANQYVVFERGATGITLNNSSDSVRLLTPAGDEWFRVEYEGAKSGCSYSFNTKTEAYVWTEMHTPGTPFEVTENEEAVEVLGEDVVVVDTLDILFELSEGTNVQIQGVVMIPPGVSGKQRFYTSDDTSVVDKLQMVEIYQHRSQFPDLHVGDAVSIIGELRKNEASITIAVDDESAISIEGSGLMPDIPEVPLDLLASDMLVSITGVVERVNKTSIRISDDRASLLVYMIGDSAPIIDSIEPDDEVYLSGFVRSRGSALALYVFDVRYVEIRESIEEEAVDQKETKLVDAESKEIELEGREETSQQFWYIGSIPLAAGLGWLLKRFITPKLW